MKIINNNPKYEPVIGKFVQIGHQLSFLEADCLYLMPSVCDGTYQEAKAIINNLMDIDEITHSLIGNYSCIRLQEFPFFEDKNLQESFIKNEYNALLGMTNYNRNVRQYIFVKIGDNNSKLDIEQEVNMLIYSAERYAKQLGKDILLQNLLNDIEESKRWLLPILYTPEFQQNFFTRKENSFWAHRMCIISPRKYTRNEILGLPGKILDIHQKKELIKRIIENVNKVRKTGDKKASAELTTLLNCVPTECIVEMLKNLTPSQLKKATSYLDPNVYAEKSRLRFEIHNPKEVKGYTLPTNKKIKNVGTYQLFIYKGDYFKAVNFSYKSSFIVYLIYLMDKYKKREEIDPIDLLQKKWEEEYLRLFNIIYPNHTDEAKSTYMTLCSEFKENNKEKRKKRLCDCYADIKACVGSSCEELGEIFYPHIIENAGDHLSTKAYNIYIPYQLL